MRVLYLRISDVGGTARQSLTVVAGPDVEGDRLRAGVQRLIVAGQRFNDLGQAQVVGYLFVVEEPRDRGGWTTVARNAFCREFLADLELTTTIAAEHFDFGRHGRHCKQQTFELNV